ncbi:NAD-dependent epimerase/dehydratase family protein [Sphingomonas psychrotolerans]|uniref:NAD-dependent epimerase/dehydratase family protein n=1 Tax=Sphingomonas psychrotolerans TaxID=1327635 RepID=A0ABU3MYZ9_9SPHN|nr:NAD-dependent epimerase/dehydratase family protein [Sphingomonas psychrotolerans]MDT8757358.1 NAD-dependent epimerase/dehydratase family protein [Sphingomonas psychrotolerans]
MATLAITGGTGFVGTRLIGLAAAAGHQVRALTRRDQAPREHIAWVRGDLGDTAALAQLCQRADAVIHVAGVVNAPDRTGFVTGNIEGTRNILTAAEGAGVQRFVHVSSLAAREPGMSDYGWSKAEAEQLVEHSLLDTIVVRPPAIYGPGDLEMLELFRLAKKGIALLPPGGRLSVIEVGDLGRLLLALAGGNNGGHSFDCDDGRPGGWTHKEFGLAIGIAVGKRVAPIALPRPLMMAGAHLDRLVRGKGAKLTPDRVAYFCHEDWVINPARRPPADLWTPQVETEAGLAATAAWYREQGLL